MNKFYSLIVLFLLFLPFANSQVVMRALLSQDHEGVVESILNFPGQKLRHQWDHQKTEGLKSTFRLNLYATDRLINTYDVRIRNLSIALYIEVRMPYKDDGSIKTLSGIYDKGNKWMRVKMAPHEGCKREGTNWGRLDQINSFDQILDYLVRQLDENVLLNCYAQ